MSATFGFAVDLPPGWRRSDRLSSTMAAGDLVGQDIFTIRTTDDERRAIAASDFMGPAYSHALVIQAWRVSAEVTPLLAVQRGYAGIRLGQVVSNTTIAGAAAVKVTNGAQYTESYYVMRNGTLFVISFLIAQDAGWHPSGATEAQLRGMIASLRFL